MKGLLISLLIGASLLGVGCTQEVKTSFEEGRKQAQEDRSKEEKYEEAFQMLKSCVESSDSRFTIERKNNKIYLHLNVNDVKLSSLFDEGWSAEYINRTYGGIKESVDELITSAKSKTSQYSDDIVIIVEIAYGEEVAYKIDSTGKVTKDLFKDFEEKEAKIKAKEEEKRRKRAEEEEAKRKAEEEKAQKEAEEKAKQQESLEQKNAIKKAESYLKWGSFSRTGLIGQLEYEGFPTETATYAVDNVSVDWNEQCAKKAKSYMEWGTFSRDGLYNQLQFEGFTDEQIQYGLSSVGY